MPVRRQPNKKAKLDMTNTNPLLVERFHRVLSHVGPGPIDLGFPKQGCLRPVIGDFRDACQSTVLSIFWSHDRTIKEWIELLSEYRLYQTQFTWPVFLEKPLSPLFCKQTHATELEKLFLKNQRMRWICRKFIARIRKRIMDKRIVGDTDLYTMCTIPESRCIRVYDITTRSVYLFHNHTMEKLVIRSLLYCSYGFASPHIPKNPYTNIKWNLWQLISITSQLMRAGSLYCKPIPFILTLFLKSKFSLKYFLEKNLRYLQVEAAIHFFEDLEDGDAKEVFLETYDDLCSYVDGHIYPLRVRRIRKLLKETKDRVLLNQWGTLITSFWIFFNHKFMWKWGDMAELTCHYHRLQRETVAKHFPKPDDEPINIIILVDGVSDT